MALLPSFLLAFGDFEVRMCRTFVWPRLIFPDAVFLKRLAAPEWVFNLGIFFLVFLDRLGYPSKASAGQGFPYAHKALTIIPGKSDLIHSWSVRLYGFVSLIPNALFKNSMIRCRASYPCHGSGTGRPPVVVPRIRHEFHRHSLLPQRPVHLLGLSQRIGRIRLPLQQHERRLR